MYISIFLILKMNEMAPFCKLIYRTSIVLYMYYALLSLMVLYTHKKTLFTRESSYCFQRVLAIAILTARPSVCLSHRWISQKRCKLGLPNLHRWLPGRL